jgi:hypothetical protein
MLAWSLVAIGFVLLHAFWLFFFLIGSLTLESLPKAAASERNSSDALMEVVLASATGMAVTGFYGFIVGVLGLFYLWTLPFLIVILAVPAHLRGAGLLQRDFWRNRGAVIARAVSWPSAIVYALGLLIAVPAALPEIAFDPNLIHLPYALDWSRAHSLTVDQTLRFPYYVMNWQLLFGWMFLLGAGNWTALLSALCGVLCGLGITAAVAARMQPAGSAGAPPATAATIVLVAAPLMLFLSPAFMRWDVTSMIDIPIALLFLATALLAVKGLEEGGDRETLARLILCGGFFVGLKPSFFMFVPLIAVLVWLVARRAAPIKWGATLALLLFVLAASPWYVKSFIQDGDPLAPYLNLVVTHKDAKFTSFDWDQITKDLARERDAVSLLKLPVRIVLHSNTERFREYGVTFALLGIYLPFAFLWAVLVTQNRRLLGDRRLLVLSACAAYGVAYWIGTSYIARYSLLFTPVLCACLGLWLLQLSRLGRFAAVAAAALALGCAIPTPSSAEWLGHLALANYRDLGQLYRNREDYLERNLPGYKEEQYILRFEEAPGRTKRVLGMCCQELNLQFRLHGVVYIGDYIGPERYLDLNIAIHTHRLGPYLRRFNVDAILAQRKFVFSSHEIDELIEQAKQLGFRTGPVFDKQNVTLIREEGPL